MSILAASLLVLAAGSSSTEQTTPAPPEATKPAEADHDPIICQRSTEIGSRLKRRKTCLHKSEWDRQRLENKQMIDRTQVQRGTKE
jgi:predicted secreted protein